MKKLFLGKLTALALISTLSLNLALTAQAETVFPSDVVVKGKIKEQGGYVGKPTKSGLTSFTVPSSAGFVSMTNTAARAVILPNPTTNNGQEFTIYDGAATAGTGNITVTTTGSLNIGGASSSVIAVNRGFLKVKSNGVTYDIIDKLLLTPATDSLAAHLAGTETVTGAKTFSATTILSGSVYKRGFETKAQGAPTAKTGAATISVADMLTGIVTLSQSTSATVALTTDTGTAIDAGVTMSAGDSFDFTIINLSAAAADTGTLTAGASGVTLVGRVIIPSAHSTTIANSSMTFRVRKTASNTFIIYAI